MLPPCGYNCADNRHHPAFPLQDLMLFPGGTPG